MGYTPWLPDETAVTPLLHPGMPVICLHDRVGVLRRATTKVRDPERWGCGEARPWPFGPAGASCRRRAAGHFLRSASTCRQDLELEQVHNGSWTTPACPRAPRPTRPRQHLD